MDSEHKKGEIHLVNVSGTLYKPPAKVSHTDILPNFLPDAAKNNPELQLSVHLPQGFLPSKKVIAFSPELEKERNIPVSILDSVLKIQIPKGIFSGYLKIVLSAVNDEDFS